ncbi:MAG: hypothetical protein COY68_05005 [Candidatus Levybacteria bacterium CG_4_10_14_0_8_um_filter_35_23]|nr:MAG: hypothetical protein COY68_05005 [Candidatus Levybacteria bacterium CG_4_10_14_0_8_um_filter_35_23]
MTNPEMTPSLRSVYIKTTENIPTGYVIGVNPEDLTDEIVEIVTDTYTLVTGSLIPNMWIFSSDRIKHEIKFGRDTLSLELPTAIGAVKLSAKKEEGLVIFDFSLNKNEKWPNQNPHYEEIEQKFREKVNQKLIKIGIGASN